MSDIPEWAIDGALAIRNAYYKADSKVLFDDEVEIIARALVKAKEQGIAEEKARRHYGYSEEEGRIF